MKCLSYISWMLLIRYSTIPKLSSPKVVSWASVRKRERDRANNRKVVSTSTPDEEEERGEMMVFPAYRM